MKKKVQIFVDLSILLINIIAWIGAIRVSRFLSDKGLSEISGRIILFEFLGFSLLLFILGFSTIYLLDKKFKLLINQKISNIKKIYRKIISICFLLLFWGSSIIVYLGFSTIRKYFVWQLLLFSIPIIITIITISIFFKDQLEKTKTTKFVKCPITRPPVIKNLHISLKTVIAHIKASRSIGIVIILLSFFAFVLCFLLPSINIFNGNLIAKVILLSLISVLLATGLTQYIKKKDFLFRFFLSIIWLAVIYTTYSIFNKVSNLPFATSWSEGSWLFNASQFFPYKVYGTFITPPSTFVNRSFMQSLIYLVPISLPIWVHRLWFAILLVSMPLITSILLIKYLKINGFDRWLVLGWTFLFFQTGSIYFNFFLIPILFLLIGRKSSFIKTLLIVIIGAIWAGPDRIQWYPLSGCIAAIIYFFSEKKTTSFFKYILKPIIYISTSIGFGFLSQHLYMILSNQSSVAYSVFLHQNILLYRLFPNVNMFLGIFPTIIIFTLPLLILFINYFIRNRNHIHWIRIAGITTILLVFLFGGLLVSSKIGGGTNLHNLDSYMFLLLLSVGLIKYDGLIIDQLPQKNIEQVKTKWLDSLIMIVTLIFFSVIIITKPPKYDYINSYSVVLNIKQLVDEQTKQNNNVLFISQPQLLTFKYINNVKPKPEYELVYMMEMAMENNKEYLENFYSVLEMHQYSMIICDVLYPNNKGPFTELSEENNAWAERIARPILKYYHPYFTNREFNIQVLIPNVQ